MSKVDLQLFKASIRVIREELKKIIERKINSLGVRIDSFKEVK